MTSSKHDIETCTAQQHYVKLIQPDKARSGRNLGVLCNDLQIRTAARPLEHDDASITRNTARNQELVLGATNHHAANLVQSSVDLLDELELRLDREDGDGVSTRVKHWSRVAVRDVDEWLREMGAGFCQQDFTAVPVSLRRRVGWEDAETGLYGRRPVRRRGDLLLGEGAGQLVESVKGVTWKMCLVSATEPSVTRRSGGFLPRIAICLGPLP